MSRRSALYVGRVRHRRRGEVDHALSARVVMGLFDLDELADLDADLVGFGHDRPAPIQFRSADHGHADGGDLRAWLAEVTAATGADVSGPARVLCMPRVLGLAFDPLSVWYCHDAAGRPSAIVHEVRNTFGGRHAYVVPDPLGGTVAPPGPPRTGDGAPVLVHHRADKAFHVSPFFDVDGDYDFTLRLPDEHVAVAITHHAGDGHELTASFVGRRVELTSASLWRAMASHPLLPHRVLGQIHVHALHLWRKGARYRPVPPRGPAVTTGAPTAPASPTAASTPGAPTRVRDDARPPTAPDRSREVPAR